ncbi:MAG TPA: DNA integrity scanning protein DisA [Clostridia bacterium]|jgi:diadenylate cyclase|nr:DNA integrity scanning protein DisA [Clostridia bacterium]
MAEVKTLEDEQLKALRAVAPGTPLREGLDNILRAKTGALIVVGNSPQVLEIIEGGFYIDAEYSPANLYELAKMDGAIILSPDCKKILYANAQLIPSPLIASRETGIRHRTAERTAKQTGEMVISISKRRNVITIYKGNWKYALRDISLILSKANQALQTLEKYKKAADHALINLGALEFEEQVTLFDVAVAIQRCEMVRIIVAELERYISELGTEGRLIGMQLEELVNNVEEEGELLIRDYCSDGEKTTVLDIRKQFADWSLEDLLDLNQICRLLGYTSSQGLDLSVEPRGYRILRKIPRIPMVVVENLVGKFGELNRIYSASIDDLDEVEGIGEVRARLIKESLRKLREQLLLERYI